MAYVFVQHLDQAHGSLMAKILSNRTALPLEEVREGEIFPDHLYVIIPNTTLTITSRVLHLRSRDPAERPHRPIDIFFLSLAEKRVPKVIGVILSWSVHKARRREALDAPSSSSTFWSSCGIILRQCSAEHISIKRLSHGDHVQIDDHLRMRCGP
jgi:hypothetical protein